MNLRNSIGAPRICIQRHLPVYQWIMTHGNIWKEYRNINLPSVLVIGILRKIIGISFQRWHMVCL